MTTSLVDRIAAKFVTARQAIARIAPGQRIFVGSGAAAPARLVEALVTDGAHLADNDVVHILTLAPAPYTRAGLEDRFRHVALFIGENTRQAVDEGRAVYVPVFLSEVPRLLASPRGRVDVALIQVSPPDARGYVSLGVSVDVVRAAVDAANFVVAEVNPHMPRTHGDSFLHVDRIDALVHVDSELPERAPSPLDDVALAIGRHVASLVPDGATLQVGIGSVPDAVLAALGSRRDLGIHSEMISDGVMQLALSGAITGRKKSLLPGKIVTSFLLGTRELYRWADDNPELELRPSDFTNDPGVIARHDDMIAINGALAVDLSGQVAADTVDGRFYSGIGGQVDFIRGAARSRRGKPIIAMRSTAKRGSLSRVRATLEEGAGVVTSRGDVHYVVTEYGVADLWGRSVRERALALVEVAHPDHRADLLGAAKARRYVLPDQRIPRPAAAWEATRTTTLADGARLATRGALPSDELGLQDLLYGLSDDSERQRYLGAHPLHPHREVRPLLGVDGCSTVAYVALLDDRLVGYARLSGIAPGKSAEIDVVVREGYHRRGIGRSLVERLVELAVERGSSAIEADLLVHNEPMVRLMAHAGTRLTHTIEDGIHHIAARLAHGTDGACHAP